MTNTEYAIAYKEVFEILKYIPQEDYNKIPNEKIELYKAMQDKSYNFKYDPSKTLDEQNVTKRAKAIIGLLFRDYWAADTQREKILAKQKYERQKNEKEKIKNYQYENLFTKNSIYNTFKNSQNEKVVEQKEETKDALIKYNDGNFITRLFNKIKRFFSKKKNNY